MTREDLFKAVGEMEEDFLAENESPAARSRRMTWRNVLVAAVVTALMVGLAITAAAAWIGTVKGRAAKETLPLLTTINGNVVEGGTVDIVDVYIDFSAYDYASASTAMGEGDYYAPAALEKEDLAGYYCSEPGDTDYELSWLLGKFDYVQFRQSGAAYYNRFEPAVSLSTYNEEYTVVKESILVENLEVYRVCLATDGGNLTEQYFFWTNGKYIFTLICPHDMEREKVEEIILSVESVESIQHYVDIIPENKERRRQEEWAETRQMLESAPEDYIFRMELADGWIDIGQSGTIRVRGDFEWAETWNRMFIYPRIYEGQRKYNLGQNWSQGLSDLDGYSVSWAATEYGDNEIVYFSARASSVYGEEGVLDYIYSASDACAVESEMVTWGDYRFLEVRYAEGSNGTTGRRILYWADDGCIYILNCPYAMPDGEILEILESIR